MRNFIILLKKNLLEMIRNKRIIIFGLVFVAISIISALTAKFLPELYKLLLGSMEMGDMYIVKEGTVADSYVQFIANMGEVTVLLIGIMFANVITKEKTTGTYQTLKMNNVKDHEIVLSHFVAQVLLVTLSYTLSVAALVVLNILFFNQIMGLRGFVVLIYIYLLLLVTIGFSLLSSCICKKSGKSYLVVILSYFGFMILDLVPRINKVNPFHLLTISTELMYTEAYVLKDHLLTSLSSFGIIIILVILSLLFVKNRINNKREIMNEEHNV